MPVDFSSMTIEELAAFEEQLETAKGERAEEQKKELQDALKTVVQAFQLDKDEKVQDAVNKALSPLGYSVRYVGKVTAKAKVAILSKLTTKTATFDFKGQEIVILAREYSTNPDDIRATLTKDFEAVRDENQRGRCSVYKRK